MPFDFSPLDIPDVIVIEPKVFGDSRGFFMETYRQSDFAAHGISAHFSQDNHSRSNNNVNRGLHYQLPPMQQGKLVRVLRGAIFDVAVDIRVGSPHYGKWVATELSEANRLMLWIPPGFAHGFATLAENTELAYKTTGEYAPSHDRGIAWNDPAIAIDWPVPNPLVSQKDMALPSLTEAENNFHYESAD